MTFPERMEPLLSTATNQFTTEMAVASSAY